MPVSLPKLLLRSAEQTVPVRVAKSANLAVPRRSGQTMSVSTRTAPSYIESARTVLDKAALAADIATVGLAAGGVTAPVATAAKALGLIAELGLVGVNKYDAEFNGNEGPWNSQKHAMLSRFLPGGRALQRTLKVVRGPVGPLRNGAGRFRRSHIDNRGVEEVGDVLRDRSIGAFADRIFDGQ
jgi:hypothetical protein